MIEDIYRKIFSTYTESCHRIPSSFLSSNWTDPALILNSQGRLPYWSLRRWWRVSPVICRYRVSTCGGRFCLTHGDQKFVVETEYISGHGIKDGDEACF
ncbi:hypothetical protein MLD38_013963 [Melastoma candidum]|uniref:Uncharacterized protein n=1 Tax=Melastoma candidum TaxID=119954 RepID=A0ACB9RFF3_9MYRT|nr:hypothetical protein MLD38_013963 [Melastoma candidum]